MRTGFEKEINMDKSEKDNTVQEQFRVYKYQNLRNRRNRNTQFIL